METPVTSLTAPPPLFSSTTPTTASESSDELLSSDFETFLKMLTVQVQNQDPLNPVDSTDYATQLATFSGVEQQVLTNDLLEQLSNALTGGTLAELGGYVGKEGLVQADAVFDGETPVAVRPTYHAEADSAALVVRDAGGNLVQRFALDVIEDAVLWEGVSEAGNRLPSGTYNFQVESYRDTVLISTATAPVYSRIDEARVASSGEILLRMADGTEVPSTGVSGLRAITG